MRAHRPDHPVPETLLPWPGHTGNWHRWNNNRGTLNLLGPHTTLRAAAEVRTGEVISCARDVSFSDPYRPGPAGGIKRLKSFYGPQDKYSTLGEDLTVRTHGVVNTHIDALSHAGYGGFGFNGRLYSEVISMEDGARELDVREHGPIVTRGILVDVPRGRNVQCLQPGEWVIPADIAQAADRVQPGDAFVIRTGVTISGVKGPDEKSGHHGTIAGVHWDCIELLARKDVSVFATDCGADVYPGPADKPVFSPVHALCLVFYGIALVHNMNLEGLAHVCLREGRDCFMFTVSPLQIPGASGSLATPVAIF